MQKNLTTAEFYKIYLHNNLPVGFLKADSTMSTKNNPFHIHINVPNSSIDEVDHGDKIAETLKITIGDKSDDIVNNKDDGSDNDDKAGKTAKTTTGNNSDDNDEQDDKVKETTKTIEKTVGNYKAWRDKTT